MQQKCMHWTRDYAHVSIKEIIIFILVYFSTVKQIFNIVKILYDSSTNFKSSILEHRISGVICEHQVYSITAVERLNCTQHFQSFLYISA